MRQIALDTETTGLSTEHHHRVIEIGCVELVNRRITGNDFHCYLDPEREVDPGAFAVHGISTEFLRGKPKFAEVLDDFLAYIQGAELIIHNASFDVGFLNHELALMGHGQQITAHCAVFCTLVFARKKHPGRNNLDALCKRYGVDNTHRHLHGALLDADLLARVYLAMTGGQGSLFAQPEAVPQQHADVVSRKEKHAPLPMIPVSPAEEQAHLEFVQMLTQKSGVNLWREVDET